MRRAPTARGYLIRACIVLIMGLYASKANAQLLTDSAGRTVPRPAKTMEIQPASPEAEILLYMLAPDLTGRSAHALGMFEQTLAPVAFYDFPEVPRITSENADPAASAESRPDLVLQYGSIGQSQISLADLMQQKSGIPHALVDDRLDKIPEAFRILGSLVGRSAAAEEKARAASLLLADVAAIRQTLSITTTSPRVYFAGGSEGLQTGGGDSVHVELLKYAGAVNVAEDLDDRQGLAPVSFEQVQTWDPDVILTSDPAFYDRIWEAEHWAPLRAVRTGRVYLSPSLPLGWLDQPASANRLIGLRWLLAVLYPENFSDELEPETRNFFRIFYRIELTDAQLDKVLGPGTRPETGNFE